MDKKVMFRSPNFLVFSLVLTLVIIASLMYATRNADPAKLYWYDKMFTSRVSSSSVNEPSTNDAYTSGGKDSSGSSSGSKDDKGYNGGIVGAPIAPDTGANNAKDQKLIKTGNVSITVDDFDKSIQKVRDIANSFNGLVTNSSDSGKDNDRISYISIKVPAKDFDATMKQIKAVGLTVLTSSENSSDVTQSYTDLKARLKNQKALGAQLILILNKAVKVSDILEVQQQLSNVQGEIEVLQSQINYYDSQIDMSTISVSMKLNTQSLSVIDNTWKPLGTFRTALQSLVGIFMSLVDLTIWLVVLSPIVLIPLAIIWIIQKARKEGNK